MSIITYIQSFSIMEISGLLSITVVCYNGIKKLINYRLFRKKRIEISDFILYEKLMDYKKGFIRTQCVDRPPEIEDEPRESYQHANRQDLINFFLKQAFNSPSKKFYLVLGGAGMGKTTFMVNLYLAYYNNFKKTNIT